MNALVGILVFVVQKLATALAQLFVVATLVFSIMYIMPGDPVLLLGSESSPSPETIANMRARLGLDQPVMTQYVTWLTNIVHFDLGTSILGGYSVGQVVADNLPRTLELGLAAIVIASLIGVPVGIAAALKPRHAGRHGADLDDDHRHLGAGLYPRGATDHPVQPATRLAALERLHGYRAQRARAFPPAGAARLHARLRARGLDRAHDALVDAGDPQPRLHPRAARQGHVGAAHHLAARAAQTPRSRWSPSSGCSSET
jgi:hypothetical protein